MFLGIKLHFSEELDLLKIARFCENIEEGFRIKTKL